jgi:exonuclease III
VWNVGGFKSSRSEIFDSVSDSDVCVFVETFLNEEDLQNFQIPSGFLSFSVPGLRDPQNEEVIGRAAGGILVLVRSSRVKAASCTSKVLSHALLQVNIQTTSGSELVLLCAYRSGNSKSPVFDTEFFDRLGEAVATTCELGQSCFVMGDFNSKIGDSGGPLGLVEEFELLLPAVSASTKTTLEGRKLLEALSQGEFALLHFDDAGRYPLTFKKAATNVSRAGGSVIDFIFCSLNLAMITEACDISFEEEISPHARLSFVVNITEPQVNPTNPPTSIPRRKTMLFDYTRVNSIAHTPALVALADGDGDYTVQEALEVIEEFVGQYTVTRDSTCEPRSDKPLEPHLRDLRREMRMLERRIKSCWREDTRVVLEQQHQTLIEAYRMERDSVAAEKRAEVRARFWEAQRAGNHHLAWKLARIGLAGKGGGIKTSSTTSVSRESWEAHFSHLFTSMSGPSLGSVDVGTAVNQGLDKPVESWEVTQALERKKNLKAPGPDGFRVDFLRLVRYDETVCRAVANLFTIILRSSEIPESWDEALLFVLYKGKGDKSDPNNYRGITLKSHFLKLLEAVLCSRFVAWLNANSLLPDEQLAYRKGLNGSDHLYTLHVLRESAIKQGKVLFTGFLDLKKAFPSVDRSELLKDLVSVGVSSQTVSLIRRLYSFDTFRLLLDGVPGSVVFCVVSGVHEGSCLSPILFIFFIRDLPQELANSTSSCPTVGGGKLCSLVYADDVSVFCFLANETQVLVCTSVTYFARKKLSPNPQKCEFVVFTGKRAQVRDRWIVAGVTREAQFSARYLGVQFQQDGRWNEQLEISLCRSRVALGRCKIMARTVGFTNVRHLVNLFDATVSSIYRYGLGVWGVTCAQVSKLDDLFVEFIRWLYRLPLRTGKLAILGTFARRCAKCDALFLAAVQIAQAGGSKNKIWEALVEDLKSRRSEAGWFEVVTSELVKRGLLREVLAEGRDFRADRRKYGVVFAQFCFHEHCNALNGSSADLIRLQRNFGIMPFLFRTHPEESRFLLSFLLSCWRFLNSSQCQNYPRICETCDQENSSDHVLFDCVLFSLIRDDFELIIGEPFSFELLESSDDEVCTEVVRFGKSLFSAICELCEF